MKRAAAEDEKENGRSESDVMNKEPPTKKSTAEPAPNPEVIKLQQKLLKSDTKLQHMVKMESKGQGIIEELRERVRYLEDIIDTKEDILENAKASEEDKLKKKLNDLMEQLEESQLQAAQQRAEDSAKVGELTNHLQEERQKSAGLYKKLEHVAELEKKVHVQTSQLEEERKRSAELMKKLTQAGDKFRADFESFAATLASVDVPTSSANLVSPRPPIPPRPSNAASTQQKTRMDSNGVAPKRDKSSSNFREIQKNEYSDKAKRLIMESRSPGGSSAFVEISPRVKSVNVNERIQGLFSIQRISQRTHIAELCGYVSLQSECANRDIIPGQWMNDCTFLVEKDGEKLIIDARQTDNIARYVRRSCNPNAELRVITSGTDLHVVIRAKDGVSIRNMQEVSIAFDDDWKNHPRPKQGCTCKGDELKTCEIELFFNKARQVEGDWSLAF